MVTYNPSTLGLMQGEQIFKASLGYRDPVSIRKKPRPASKTAQWIKALATKPGNSWIPTIHTVERQPQLVSHILECQSPHWCLPLLSPKVLCSFHFLCFWFASANWSYLLSQVSRNSTLFPDHQGHLFLTRLFMIWIWNALQRLYLRLAAERDLINIMLLWHGVKYTRRPRNCYQGYRKPWRESNVYQGQIPQIPQALKD